MRVLKFGGSSMGSAQSILIVKSILDEVEGDAVVVVSAVGGVTDLLIKAAGFASQNKDYVPLYHDMVDKHRAIVAGLFNDPSAVNARLDAVFNQIGNLLQGVALLKELSFRIQDAIVGQGEILSSIILNELMCGSAWFDSRSLIVTHRAGHRNLVLPERTNVLIGSRKQDLKRINIFPGFIASDEAGQPTTLGRGGSDYTAALLAAGFDASILEIWTDVDGFMTADPRIISRAYTIDHLTYSEAMELSHFGAKVIYSPTILPVCQKNIPVVIKNTFNRMGAGTLIDGLAKGPSVSHIKGISSIRNVSLLTIQGPGMVGVSGISMRLFGALAKRFINVILISQASSENSISFVVDSAEAEEAKTGILEEFSVELNNGQILPVSEESQMAVVAIVGERMKHTTGIAGKLFHSLGMNGVNVFAIAQGASEVNISIVIKEENLKKSLNALHDAFFLSHFKVLHLFLAGVGTVGSRLIEKLCTQTEKLRNSDRLVIRIAGVCNSRFMVFSPQGMEPSGISDLLSSGEPASPELFSRQIRKMNLANSVFVDCTASPDVAAQYLDLLSANINVVTANKIASSSQYSLYRQLKNTAREKGVKFLFETNVGAALPIISPINDLLKSGDRIMRLEAVLSGTLNFIVNELSATNPLSRVIEMAREKGYSEPDPRIDLSGIDVARKILILAREAGYEMEPGDVKREAFIPASFFTDEPVAGFMNSVAELDDAFEQKRLLLSSQGLRMRYVATLENGKASLGMKLVDDSHPFYHLEGSNNVVLIWSDNYREHPMQIKGYGAGAEVTASGVFADIIKVANL